MYMALFTTENNNNNNSYYNINNNNNKCKLLDFWALTAPLGVPISPSGPQVDKEVVVVAVVVFVVVVVVFGQQPRRGR